VKSSARTKGHPRKEGSVACAGIYYLGFAEIVGTVAAKPGSSKDKDFSINDELIGDNLDPQATSVTLHTSYITSDPKQDLICIPPGLAVESCDGSKHDTPGTSRPSRDFRRSRRASDIPDTITKPVHSRQRQP
jgi:hypothetical protein